MSYPPRIMAAPHAPARILLVDPKLPEWLPVITLRGLRVGEAGVSLRFARGADGGSTFEVTELRGELRVFSHPAPWSIDERPELDFEDRLGA